MSREAPAPAATPRSLARRYGPLAVLALGIAAAWAGGLHEYFSFAAIVEHREALKAFVADNFILAVAAYALAYIGVVALSLPGAVFLTMIGGLLFGWLIGAPVTVLAATLGAQIVFEVVRTSFGESLVKRAGPLAKKLRAGFARDGFSYLLFLRLVPAVPFFALNAVAGLSGISRRNFALATLIGIIPATLALSYFGSGLDALIDAQVRAHEACAAAKGAANCALEFDPSALLTRELLLAFLALGLVSLIPIVVKRVWRKP